MIKTLRCPVCDKFVEPFEFALWPGASVSICPTCRIGIGDVGKIMKSGRDKMIRRAKIKAR